jgi:purine-nucleoside phosphorylase
MIEWIQEAAAGLKRRIHTQPEIGIMLGSGLEVLADEVQDAVCVRFEDIPHFPVSSVVGHRGELIAGNLGGKDLLICSGRVHYYEGYSMQEVVFPVRVMAACGIKTFIVTNACGALNESLKRGDIVMICDHINLMGDNPLKGSSDFVDLTEAYSSRLRKLALATADKLGICLQSGVYIAISGPAYETPAEIRAYRIMGADMVGMSTVPEVIMANRLGMQVLGLSVVTNMAAGMSGKPLCHQEVIEIAKNSSPQFRALLKGVVKALN